VKMEEQQEEEEEGGGGCMVPCRLVRAYLP